MTKHEEITQAKATLEKYGYAVRSLWSAEDVQDMFECTEEQALDIIEQALDNDATMEQAWFAIEFHGDEVGLTRV